MADDQRGGPAALPPRPDAKTEEFWRNYLTRGDAAERKVRAVFRAIPSSPRCKLCAAPFGGIGAPIMRLIGKRPSDKDPQVCNSCFAFIAKHHGGAEIELTLLFADIRGSTTLAERMSPSEFRGLLDRFYRVGSEVVMGHDGGLDKFVGDELIAFYFPMMAGEQHAARAVETATALLRATGHEQPGGPWAPLGVGVHTGTAWVGAVGDDTHTEITALGDAVNVTARLAARAEQGEVLVTTDAARAAGLQDGLPRRTLELKGKELPIDVVSLRVTPSGHAA